jgi:hypothetical protein
MSDFRPSPSAIMEAGNAVTDLFFTIADKLYAAEATTQFNNVQESLRRSVNDFSLNLQSDPDWKSYQEKGAKFIDEQNQIIDKMATNGHAKQALQQWWMSQRDTLMEKVGQAQWNGRANETIGTANKSINDTMQSVVSGTLSADEGKAKLRVLQDPLVRSNLVDKATAEANYKDWDHKIDQAAATHGAFALIRQKTADGLPNFQAAHDFLADPKNTLGLSDVEVEQIDTRVTHLETVQDSEDKRTNDKLEAPLGDVYSKVMLGDAGLPEFKAIIEQSRGKWVGKDKGERDRKWAGYYESEIRSLRADKKAAEKDNSVFDGLLADSTNENIDQSVIIDNARDLMAKHEISATQYKQVLAAVSPRVKARVKAYEEVFKTDPKNMTPEDIKGMQTALGYYRSWAADNMDATDKELSSQAQFYKNQAVNKVLKNLDSYYTARRQAMSAVAAGETLPLTPGGLEGFPFGPQTPSYPQQLVSKLKNISILGTQIANGTTYYNGSDGKTYQVSKSGSILWWDGKKWQTM